MKRSYLLPGIFLFSIAVLLAYFLNDSSSCVRNEGFAFGLYFSYFEIVSILFLISIVYLSLKVDKIVRYNVLVIVIFGLINTLERILFGSICDYFSLFGLAFNIADVVITFACINIVIYFIKRAYESRSR